MFLNDLPWLVRVTNTQADLGRKGVDRGLISNFPCWLTNRDLCTQQISS